MPCGCGAYRYDYGFRTGGNSCIVLQREGHTSCYKPIGSAFLSVSMTDERLLTDINSSEAVHGFRIQRTGRIVERRAGPTGSRHSRKNREASEIVRHGGPMSASVIGFSLGLFVLAGLCEIAGGWMVWQRLRESRPWSWGLLGGAVLIVYGVIPIFQPAHFAASMPPMAGFSSFSPSCGLGGRW
jgi:hypothetical protein